MISNAASFWTLVILAKSGAAAVVRSAREVMRLEKRARFGFPTPHPSPLPVEGRGRPVGRFPEFLTGMEQGALCRCSKRRTTRRQRASRISESARCFSLSPQRGEGRGEG